MDGESSIVGFKKNGFLVVNAIVVVFMDKILHTAVRSTADTSGGGTLGRSGKTFGSVI
jgi:hypothetical protein